MDMFYWSPSIKDSNVIGRNDFLADPSQIALA